MFECLFYPSGSRLIAFRFSCFFYVRNLSCESPAWHLPSSTEVSSQRLVPGCTQDCHCFQLCIVSPPFRIDSYVPLRSFQFSTRPATIVQQCRFPSRVIASVGRKGRQAYWAASSHVLDCVSFITFSAPGLEFAYHRVRYGDCSIMYL